MEFGDITFMVIYWFMIYTTVLFFMIFLRHRRHFFTDTVSSRLPSLSIILPAFNEGEHISKSIESVLNIDYPGKKVYVVNDGSTDNTAEIAQEYADKGLIKLINKPNTGKANSINTVLPTIDTELVAIMDADSYPTPDYAKNLVGYFSDPKVVAAVPAIKPEKTENWITKLQWVEYMFQIYLRKVFDFFKCQYVIPGAGSIYRTAVVQKFGFDEEDNLTEDTEMGFRIQKNGLKIKNSLNSVVYTSVPGTFVSFFKQRLRWYRGYIQNVVKYKDMIGKSQYGNFGIFLLPANFVWIGIMFSFAVFSGAVWALNAFNVFRQWAAMDFAFILPSFSWSYLFYTTDIYAYMALVFTAFGLTTVALGLYSSKENVDIRNKKTNYIIYFMFYPLFLMIFWLSSVLAETLRVKRKW